MGASRKLQGEIDRVLKKVQEGVDVFDSIWNKVYDTENANQKEKFEADLKKEIKKLQRYRDQIKTWIQSSEIKDKKALMDARKLIEHEMERFKVCEKETKTKAFSKEGLGQQPKTDPKEKAKSKTREWLNNVVADLDNQVDTFEAEVEGLSVKKGKTRPPRLTHLETSITRHKAHIMKLELILRLLDNDELSPEQVNDVKDFLEDYVDRNQEDFDDFSDVDELYSSLPLDKVEALEDLVTLGPSSLVKGISTVGTALKNSTAIASSQLCNLSLQDKFEEAASQDSNSDIIPRTPPPSKGGAVGSSVLSSSNIISGSPVGSNIASPNIASGRALAEGPTVASILSSPASTRVTENVSATVPSTSVNPSSSVKEDDNINFPGRRPSPAIPEISLGRGISRGLSNQPISAPMSLGSIGGISSSQALGSVSTVSDVAKRNVLNIDERVASGSAPQPLVSSLNNRVLLQQVPKGSDGGGSVDSTNAGEGAVPGGRVFSPPTVTGVQWRPQSATAFQSHETGPIRVRPDSAPDQREKLLQRLQQAQQQGPNLGTPILSGVNAKQFTSQQQNSFLQQLNPQVGPGITMQASSLAATSSTQKQHQTAIHQPSQQPIISSGTKDTVLSHAKTEETQLQQNLPDEVNTEPAVNSVVNKIIIDDDLKTPYVVTSSSIAEGSQLLRDTDLPPGQPLQSGQSLASLGVIGRRSVSDFGAIGDNISGPTGNSSGVHDENYNKMMLDAALLKLPHPMDSERVKSYVPRNPVATPASYPQQQASIIDNPAFWERLGGIDQQGTDVLFFAFYYQQNTYQQYLAARELKRLGWRFHRKYNTWFQRHEEPKVANDELERGTYVYYDFHIVDDAIQPGWCQRLKHDFTFEYSYLEDELVAPLV